METLRLLRSVKNSLFAPIYAIPSEVISLIPDHMNDGYAGLIALTHVCRRWRDIFISRSSLWARLDCLDKHKTLAYIARSKLFPLDIRLNATNGQSYKIDALHRVVRHLFRLGSLTVHGPGAAVLPDLVMRFSHPTPLLKKLKIHLTSNRDRAPAFPDTLFNGDLSSLHELSLAGFTTSLPWRNLVNLTTFKLSCVPGTAGLPFMTQLLDFLESAPLLSNVELCSVPAVLNAPPRRVVFIPHLERLILSSSSTHSTLVKHLVIPIGALVTLDFPFYGKSSPILDCLPENTHNLTNLSRITLINLYLVPRAKCVRLDGPSGQLYIYSTWPDERDSSHAVQRQIFKFLGVFNLSNIQRLAITKYTCSPRQTVDKSPIFQVLLPMNDLRVLTLTECNNLSFIRALNPEKNRLGTVACPNLVELILYINELNRFNASELEEMALARAEQYTKRPSLTIISLGEMLPKGEVFALREFFPRVDYKLDVESPEWDALPSEEVG